MKKLFALLIAAGLLFSLSACAGGSETDERTLDQFKEAIIAGGYVIEDEDTPLYELIDATNGVLFYANGEIVVIYEFADAAELKKAKKDHAEINSFETNGKFALETSVTEVIEIFNSVE